MGMSLKKILHCGLRFSVKIFCFLMIIETRLKKVVSFLNAKMWSLRTDGNQNCIFFKLTSIEISHDSLCEYLKNCRDDIT
jgi:hypothetical protein